VILDQVAGPVIQCAETQSSKGVAVRKIWTLLLPAAALTLLAASLACGGGDDDDDGAADEGADGTPAATSAWESVDGDRATPAGGDALGAYFEAMEQIGTRADAELEAISGELSNATFETDAEEIAAVQDGLLRTGQALETALIAASGLEAPPAVDAEHDTFLAALEEVLILSSELLTASEDVTTSAELDALVDSYDADLTAADDAFDAACFALQNIADANGIGRDIQCGDD
jgi:hypothetical protein